jgi:hypothetical protein
MRCVLALALALATAASSVYAQTAIYSPLGTYQPALAKWQATVTAIGDPGTGTRPVLPGLRPVDTELLTDVLLRKQPRKLQGDPALARAKIRRIVLDSSKPGNKAIYKLYGEMAEALFLESHTDWNYVRKSNATQNDVWKQINGRGHKIGGQVKFHRNGNPSRYLRDMRSDWAAKHFIVPDDHVVPLKEHIALKQQRALARGDLREFEWLGQRKARVTPLGHSSDEVVQRTYNGAKAPISEANAVYMSLGAGLALSLGQIGWGYSRGSMTLDDATYAFAKSSLFMGTAIGADQALRHVASGALRGGLRGQALVGLAILIVDTSVSFAEKGGMAALHDPAFYSQLGGSASAVVVGTAVTVGILVLAPEAGPGAPAVAVASFVAGAVTGAAAYIAGEHATNEFLREFCPSLYHSEQRRLVRAARDSIEREREAASKMR